MIFVSRIVFAAGRFWSSSYTTLSTHTTLKAKSLTWYLQSKQPITKTFITPKQKRIYPLLLSLKVSLFVSILNVTKSKKQSADKEPSLEIKSTAVLPKDEWLFEAALRHFLQQQGKPPVFNSNTTVGWRY